MTADSLHWLKLKTPLAALLAKLTVPLGVDAIPEAVSLTVAVHCCLAATRMQTMLVEVLRLVIVTVVLALLVECALSPP